jgi:hypothetical protein
MVIIGVKKYLIRRILPLYHLRLPVGNDLLCQAHEISAFFSMAGTRCML